MPGAARRGDIAYAPADAHNCPKCTHNVVGPAVSGSVDVLVNGRGALRVGDRGVHFSCCGGNVWWVLKGEPMVLVNGRPIAQQGSLTLHCGGPGTLLLGSVDVMVGVGGSGPGEGIVSAAHQPNQDEADRRILSSLQAIEKQTETTVLLNQLEANSAQLMQKDDLHPVFGKPVTKLELVRGGLSLSVTAIGIYQLPKNLRVLTGSGENKPGETWDALSSVLGLLSEGIETAHKVAPTIATYVATRAAKKAMPTADPILHKVAAAAAVKRMKSTPGIKGRPITDTDQKKVRQAITHAAQEHGFLKKRMKSATKKLLYEERKRGADAALKAAQVFGPALGKAASRFVPVLNFGVAAMDMASYREKVNAWARGEGSLGDAMVSGVKAFGSGIAIAPGLNVVGGVIANGAELVEFVMTKSSEEKP